MLRLMTLAIAALAAIVTLTPARAAFETAATAAWVYDMSTGTVLLAKNADVPLPPASMTKIMTLNMLFEALRDGRVTMDTRFPVSARAMAMQGSSMFLNQNDRPTVEELIQGIIVQSGNDACVVVAEGLAGSEDAFARLMNERGRAIGLTQSTFANSTGWPNSAHRQSMEDLGRIAVRLIAEFPEYYGYFAQTEYSFDGRVPSNHENRNPLLGLGIGADGLKTGHTSEAGYGLVGSAVQGDRRVVFVITGLPTEAARAEESERIVAWAFRQFVTRTVVDGGTVVAEAPVWLGDARSVGLQAPDDVELLFPALQQGGIAGEVVFRGPIEAPVAAGQQLAELVIPRDGLEPAVIPLVADRDVARGGFAVRMRVATGILAERLALRVQAWL
ncbi:MAG: D-alanyl-D-alanine carboxypeptidase [Rhodobacteraceae bacterium]|jgi:D-alanyl-D-alanine carboxypeptidase (penicillin-binding protein 5/6)|nr:D-alanyl-D-alanine carboxypeptidase [Paracoccaceae bacterium]